MNLQGKVCNKCKEHKSLSEFYKDKKNKDGFRYECKLCVKKRSEMCVDSKDGLQIRKVMLNGVV